MPVDKIDGGEEYTGATVIEPHRGQWWRKVVKSGGAN